MAATSGLLELLHVEPARSAPPWSQIGPELGGAPRLYVFSGCEHGIAQLKSAPIARDGSEAGEAVDAKWESAHGHAHAALCYGALSRPAPSRLPEPEWNPRWELLRRCGDRWEEPSMASSRFIDV